MRSFTSMAIGMSMLALAAWVGVFSLAGAITAGETTYATDTQKAQQLAVANGSAARTRALAQDTATDRARLEQLLTVDVVSTTALLQDIGKKTGVSIKVSGATREPTISSNRTTFQPVGFVLQADGSFTALMRTVQLLETLPLASGIQRLDLSTGSATSKAAPWHLELYVRVLTNATEGV